MDTTRPAEFDIAGYQIPDAAMESIAFRLKTVTFSDEDRIVGDVRIREMDGYDFIFVIGREGRQVVITIGGVRLPDPSNPTEKILQKLGTIAIFRGATGV